MCRRRRRRSSGAGSRWQPHNRDRSNRCVLERLRWGEYNNLGYYQQLGSVAVTAPSAGQTISLSVEVHGNVVAVSLDGTVVGNFEMTESGGMVGLISSVSQISFDQVALTALPAATTVEGQA